MDHSKVWIPLLAVVLAIAAGLSWVQFSAAMIDGGISGDVRKGRTDKVKLASRSVLSSIPQPKVAIEVTEHRFGIMDLGDQLRHTFVIRNAGAGELKLLAGRTSCECTVVKVHSEKVPPAGEGRVTLQWDALASKENFRNGAYVLTNDPQRRVITLEISGKVRTHVAASPEQVVFSTLGPGEQAESEVLLFSQAWDSLEITHIESSIPQLAWQVRPAQDESLKENQARSGQQLQLKLASGLPPGTFSGSLRVQVKALAVDDPGTSPDNSAEQPAGHKMQAGAIVERTLELPIAGEVLHSISFHGPKVNRTQGVLRLGVLPQGQEHQQSVIVSSVGEPRDWEILEVQATPAFIRTQVAPVGNLPGRFRLLVSIPDDAPLANHLGEKAAAIRLKTSHPQAKDLSLKVEFAVVPTSHGS
jgi:hypothetical protein